MAPAQPWVVEDVQMGMRNRGDHCDPKKEEPPEAVVAWKEHDQTCPSGSSQDSHGLASCPQQPSFCLLLHSPWTSGFKRTFCAHCI